MATVLIVDDNPQMRHLIRAMVGTWAEVVCECSDGAQVGDAYHTYQPDWVLMDIEMGELDGISATRQLLAAYPQARVVIVSHYNQPILREAAYTAGACGYVMKENLVELRQQLQTAE